MPTPESKHDDVEYDLHVKIKEGREDLHMQVFTSPIPEVAARHMSRIVDEFNHSNGENSMQFVSATKKEAAEAQPNAASQTVTVAGMKPKPDTTMPTAQASASDVQPEAVETAPTVSTMEKEPIVPSVVDEPKPE